MKEIRTGGRQIGAPNKLTQDLKIFIKQVLENNYEKFLYQVDLIDNPPEVA